MQDILKRKNRLIIKTPYTERGRNIIVEIKPWGIELREARCRTRLELSWGAAYNRAAQIAADKRRAEKFAKHMNARAERLKARRG